MRHLQLLAGRLIRKIGTPSGAERLHRILSGATAVLIPFFCFVGVGIVMYDFGFNPFARNSAGVNFWGQVVLNALVLLLGTRLLLRLSTRKKTWSRIFNLIGWLYLLFLAAFVLPEKAAMSDYGSTRFVALKLMFYAGIGFVFITETSFLLQFIYNRAVSPALLFVASFAILILAGTFLLKLPNATTQHIRLIDALFTSTSAVCVTGLTVVDTATRFTPFGHLIIMLLVQAGGLGIMTFAGLLAYAVGGKSTLKGELAFRDLMSHRQISNIMHFIYQVVSITFLFELAGTACIYLTVDDALFQRPIDKLFFSLFHAISAFCNAGFSTYSLGLYEPALRFNYPLHLFIALLILLGGMGFPIVFNLARYLKIKLLNLTLRLRRNPKRVHFPKLIGINSRLALVVSAILLAIGFATYLIFEQHNSLRDHPTLAGKFMTSLFAAVTPRSGGYTTFDMSLLSLPMIMIYLMLMWIGSSPGSMGGGIRTTTAGVAVLNLIAVLRGRDRAEFFKSEISHHSVRRAFAIILLSVLMLGVFIFLVSVYDGDKKLIHIAFEIFSAFSTTGLSLGITPLLSDPSKLVVILTMFAGRVGMLTLLVAFIRQSKQLYYRYPKEDITF